MRICLPTTADDGTDTPVSEHFGRAPFYTVVDTDTDAVETVENTSKHRGGTGSPPELVAGLDVDAVLTDHVGKGAITRFDRHGIEVYGDASGTVADAVAAWEAGDLPRITLENVGEFGHGDHDHGHGHDHGHQ